MHMCQKLFIITCYNLLFLKADFTKSAFKNAFKITYNIILVPSILISCWKNWGKARYNSINYQSTSIYVKLFYVSNLSVRERH